MRSGANLSFFHFHTCSMFIIHQLMHSIALNSQCPAMEVLSVWDKTKRARGALEARVCAQQQQQQQQPPPQQQQQQQQQQPQQQQQQQQATSKSCNSRGTKRHGGGICVSNWICMNICGNV